MSRRNGDRARFQKDRRRKLRHRERVRALTTAIRERAATATALQSEKPADQG
jgi:hypothetical protein